MWYTIYVEDVEDSIINFGVHSTVYTIYVEDVEMYMYLFQEDDPDKNKSWFELGADIGLEIVDDEEVEAEVDEIEANEEVARIYEDAKQRHRKIMTGGFKLNKYCKWYTCQRCRRYSVYNVML